MSKCLVIRLIKCCFALFFHTAKMPILEEYRTVGRKFYDEIVTLFGIPKTIE